jgi:hypothetical protein
VSGAIVDATGTFSIAWQVHDVQFRGQVIRFGRSLTGWLGLVIGVIAVIALTAVLLRALTD